MQCRWNKNDWNDITTVNTIYGTHIRYYINTYKCASEMLNELCKHKTCVVV